ncbi:hypothetical protein [Streptomyces sp. c-19]|uniref:hypothetical protein n=1 Tax=Streptomyces sp. c-19 TaxID=2789275 RepID=UPI00398121E1
MPPPEGEPIELPQSSEAVTWTDRGGGTLQLKPDGTFIAHDLCYVGGMTVNEATSGTGTWKESADNGQSTVEVWFESGPNYSFEALQNGTTVRLWTDVGDPDDGLQCILRQRD